MSGHCLQPLHLRWVAAAPGNAGALDTFSVTAPQAQCVSEKLTEEMASGTDDQLILLNKHPQ